MSAPFAAPSATSGLKGSARDLPDGLLFHNVQYSTENIESICMRMFCIHMQWLPLRVSIEMLPPSWCA